MKYFYETYEECRTVFRNQLVKVRQIWNAAELKSYEIGKGLTIDVIHAPALIRPEKLLILTAGEHGLEGYTGAALLNYFFEHFLDRFSADDTGLLLVHGINPYGMKFRRKTNERNIDINRNFIVDWGTFDPSVNKDYTKAMPFFQPDREYGLALMENIRLLAGFLKTVKSMGASGIERAITLGQYEQENGLYFGGHGYEPSTKCMIKLYETIPEPYQRVIHLDLHTGYGAANTMSIVNSKYEKRSSEELKTAFGYPDVVKTDADEFYEIQGDMIDFLYQLFERKFKDKHLYSTTFEFGTLGNTTLSALKTLKAIISENQLFFKGASSVKNRKRIEADFSMLYAPMDPAWRENALQKFDEAAVGILRAEGFID